MPPQAVTQRCDKVRPVSRANPVSTTRKQDDDSNGLFAEGFGHGLIAAARSSSTDNHDVSPLTQSASMRCRKLQRYEARRPIEGPDSNPAPCALAAYFKTSERRVQSAQHCFYLENDSVRKLSWHPAFCMILWKQVDDDMSSIQTASFSQ